MSETLGQPENGASGLQEKLAEARDRIITADINLEHAQKAKVETEEEYTRLLEGSLQGRIIEFTGSIDGGMVEIEGCRDWESRSDYFRDQLAEVKSIIVERNQIDRVRTWTNLILVGGTATGWSVGVTLERVEWSIMEGGERE